MELEWIEGEESGSSRLTPEQLKVYNEVLGEQARDLEQEIEDLPLPPSIPIPGFDAPRPASRKAGKKAGKAKKTKRRAERKARKKSR